MYKINWLYEEVTIELKDYENEYGVEGGIVINGKQYYIEKIQSFTQSTVTMLVKSKVQ